MNEKDQRTRYNACNDNKYYTPSDCKNGPGYQDERRDGASRTINCLSLSNTIMYTEERPTRVREQEETLIMQELQPLPMSPKKQASQLQRRNESSSSYRDTRIGIAGFKEGFDRRFYNILNSSACNN